MNKIFLVDNVLKGNTKYKNKHISEVPFKYIKWIAHNPISDQSIKNYYLENKPKDLETSQCIHCNEIKALEDMVPSMECFNLPGVFQKSNVCQDCYDKNLALNSAKSICSSFDVKFKESEIPEDFINAKIQITRLKRIVTKQIKRI